MVTVTCAAGARALVTLDGVPAAVPGQPAQLELNATVNDDRRSFFCNATLEVDGEILSKNESTELRVLCELSSRLLPQDLQRSDQFLAVSWKWNLSHGPRVDSLSHTPARRRSPAGRFGLSQELDVAGGPRAGAALRGPRKSSAFCALRSALWRGSAGARPAGSCHSHACWHLPLHRGQYPGQGGQGGDTDSGV